MPQRVSRCRDPAQGTLAPEHTREREKRRGHECGSPPEASDGATRSDGVHLSDGKRDAAGVAVDWPQKRDPADRICRQYYCMPSLDQPSVPNLHLLSLCQNPGQHRLSTPPGPTADEGGKPHEQAHPGRESQGQLHLRRGVQSRDGPARRAHRCRLSDRTASCTRCVKSHCCPARSGGRGEGPATAVQRRV